MDHDYESAKIAFKGQCSVHKAIRGYGVVDDETYASIIHALNIARKLQEGEYHLCKRTEYELHGLPNVVYEPITAAQETRKGNK